MMNSIRLVLVGSVLMILLSAFFGSSDNPPSPSNKDKVAQPDVAPAKKSSPTDELISAKVDSISPYGELAELFTAGANSTQLQRQEELKRIKGKTVQWTMRVSDVSHVSGDKYLVQSDSETPAVGGQNHQAKKSASAMIHITAVSQQEKSILLGLKAGSDVCIKGRLTGDAYQRKSLEIEPAVLCGVAKSR